MCVIGHLVGVERLRDGVPCFSGYGKLQPLVPLSASKENQLGEERERVYLAGRVAVGVLFGFSKVYSWRWQRMLRIAVGVKESSSHI